MAAGENWDALVERSVALGLSGLECLSGIPGSVGASPMQNIGAYGQEVSETIESVECLDRESYTIRTLSNADCRFSYRTSIFKQQKRERFVILRVNFLLTMDRVCKVKYAELAERLSNKALINVSFDEKKWKPKQIRQSVLELREKKGMLATSGFRSAGSFFKNVIVDRSAYQSIQDRIKSQCLNLKVPFFSIDKNKMKIPSAWLIENCGFSRGLRRSGVGISPKHSLALVNYSGTTKELLSLSAEIETKVRQVYGICLEKEPVILAECD